jgi:hypothetical protein
MLPVLPDVVLDERLRGRLLDVLGPEVERFRKLTGLDTAMWSL